MIPGIPKPVDTWHAAAGEGLPTHPLRFFFKHKVPAESAALLVLLHPADSYRMLPDTLLGRSWGDDQNIHQISWLHNWIKTWCDTWCHPYVEGIEAAPEKNGFYLIFDGVVAWTWLFGGYENKGCSIWFRCAWIFRPYAHTWRTDRSVGTPER